MGKILLFYQYTYIEYPKQIMKWQKKLCESLNLTGRILIGHEGINGTVGGELKNIELYKSIMQKNPLLKKRLTKVAHTESKRTDDRTPSTER